MNRESSQRDNPAGLVAPAAMARSACMVVGMHRSGTSALARTLNLLGAELPRQLMPAAEDNNRLGFWEPLQAYAINEAMLADVGSSWDHWDGVSPEQMRALAASAHFPKILSLLDEEYSADKTPVIKDPRNSLLLPLWVEALRAQGRTPYMFICLRHPQEVALSLAKRDGLCIQHGLLLWLRYSLDAERYTRALPRTFVRYDGLLQDWRAELVKAAADLGAPVSTVDEAIAAQVDAFLQPGERHQRVDLRTADTQPQLLEWVEAAYQALATLADGDHGEGSASQACAELDSVDRLFRSADEAYAPVMQELRADRRAQEQSLRQTQAEVVQLRSEAERVRAALADAEQRATDWHKQADIQADTARNLHQALQELRSSAAAAEAKHLDLISQQRAQLEQMESTLAQQQHQRQDDVAGATQEAARLREQLQRREQESHIQQSLRQVNNARLPALEWSSTPISATAALRCFFQSGPHKTTGLPKGRSGPKFVRDVLQAGLIQPRWYGRQVQQEFADATSALHHWLQQGWQRGIAPSPLFDLQWYLRAYPDVERSGLNPLFHYLNHGDFEGRRPSAYFDPAWYREQYPDVAARNLNALLHYLRHGRCEGRRPSVFFSPHWYCQQRQVALADALADYVDCGWRLECDPSPLFDVHSYLLQKPGLAAEGVEPLRHYLLYGEDEGLCPVPEFSPHWYAQRYSPELPAGNANLLGHFVSRGWRQGEDVNAQWSTADYVQAHSEAAAMGLDPLSFLRLQAQQQDWRGFAKAHGYALPEPSRERVVSASARPVQPAVTRPRWQSALAYSANKLLPASVEQGLRQSWLRRLLGLSPEDFAAVASAFDADYYKRRYPDSAVSAISPLEHYLRFGWREGRDPSADFDTQYYLRHSPDIAQAGANPFVHWVLHGRAEKRMALPFEKRLEQRDQKPLVSCIVPNYNHAEFLPQRLDSILEQSYGNTEIIVLDDCSTDGSRDVIEDYVQRYPQRIRAIFNAHNSGGVFRQWRKGVEAANGSLIWICESDDFCDPDFLSRLVPAFADRSVQLAFGRIQFCDRAGKFQAGLDDYRESAEPGIWKRPITRPAARWFRGGFGVNNLIANVGGCLWRAQSLSDDIWAEAQRYRILGDWYLYLTLAGGGQIHYHPEAVAFFRQHGGNTSVKSFQQPDYYQEHERLMVSLRKQWPIPESIVQRFHDKVRWQFDHFKVEKDLGPLDQMFSMARMNQSHPPKLHVLMAFLGFHPGGGEVFPIQLANALHEAGVRVSMLALDMVDVNAHMLASLNAAIPVYEASYVADYGVDAFLNDAGVTHIHSHMVSVEWFLLEKCAMQAQLPYVVTLHGSYESSGLREAQVKAFANRVDHWVYLADKNLAPLQPLKLPAEKFSKLPNAMPYDPRPFPMTRADMGISDQAVVFTLVARGIQRKGWRAAIQAFLAVRRHYPDRDLHLLLAGEGDMKEQQEELHGSHPEIHFLGYQACIQGLYRLSDVALVPSRFAGESFPLCIIEAFINGVPVVATDIGEIKSMICPDDAATAGRLVPCIRNTDEFVRAVAEEMRVMLDDDERARLQQGARELGKRYAMDELAHKYLTLYRTCMAQALAA